MLSVERWRVAKSRRNKKWKKSEKVAEKDQ
jgi:hypothetical protein